MIPVYRPYIDDEDIKSIVETIKSGWISIGPKVKEFENEFSAYIGCKHAVAVSNCTSGLFLSLKALQIGIGDEVIVPVYTFVATANVVEHVGAKPIFVDVDKDYFLLDIEKVEEIVESNDKVKAIIPVHFAGNPVDMNKLLKITKECQIAVIEDAAHAAGAYYDEERKIGSLKDTICVFSFYATKPLTTGDGGMITLYEDNLYEKLLLLRLHGMSKEAWKRYLGGNWGYDVIVAGYKFNMTDIQAALGITQLKKLDWMNKRRREIAKLYIDLLKDLEEEHLIRLPRYKWSSKPTCHIFPLLIIKGNRDKFIEFLHKKEIQTSVHFIPLHKFTYYKRKYKFEEGSFPNAKWIFEREVSLPIYPQLTEEEIYYIARTIKEFFEKYK